MRRPAGDSSGAPPAVRRRERLRPARDYVLQIRLSIEEREQIRAGAAAAGMSLGGFTARAALDAAVAGVAPAGARTTLERLAGVQLELAGVRRRLDLLRAALTPQTTAGAPADPGGEALRRCAEAAEQLTQLSQAIHRRLGGGS
jgi:uncharacterized protein (DUF1778 family)